MYPALAHQPTPSVSSPTFADRLISLAHDADQAGLRDAAAVLVGLAFTVLDNSSPVHL